MIYRKANINDLDDICILVRDSVANMISNGIYQWDDVYPARADYERDIIAGDLYLAEDDGDPVAVYAINQECEEDYRRCEWKGSGDSACVLHRLCISVKYQNRGVGKEIMRHVEEQVKDMGYRSIRLDTFTGNPYALSLYKGLGYEIRGYAQWRKGRFVIMEMIL